MPIQSDPDEWTDPRHQLGVRGEEIAKEYLEARGWRVPYHRYRLGRLEIDLVARRGRVVAFVEVKTRRGTTLGHPVEAVRWAKQREIGRVAAAWIDRHGRPGETYRFDVIGVTMGQGRPRIDHVTDAFRSGWR